MGTSVPPGDPPTDRAPTEVAQAQEIAQLRAELASLRGSHHQLVSTLDAANDGIITLPTDGSMYYNIRFVELWGIPEDNLTDLDRTTLGQFQLSQVKDPEAWAGHDQRRHTHLDVEDYSTVELKDDRVLERHVLPQRMGYSCDSSRQASIDGHKPVRMLTLRRFAHTFRAATAAACALRA